MASGQSPLPPQLLVGTCLQLLGTCHKYTTGASRRRSNVWSDIRLSLSNSAANCRRLDGGRKSDRNVGPTPMPAGWVGLTPTLAGGVRLTPTLA
jgi:hypothetical protein